MNPSDSHPFSLDPSYPQVKEHIISQTGLEYYRNRDQALGSFIQRRLNELALTDCAAYVTHLAGPEEARRELELMAREFTVGETYFFRDEDQFQLLQAAILPDILRRNRQNMRLRIWSAGCATGAEAYSVSMLLRDSLAHLTQGWSIHIVGTDINQRFLAEARRARYQDWALRGTPPAVKARCFHLNGGSWEVRNRFREGVHFQYHNLAHGTFPSILDNLYGFDLILCRNVSIYLSRELRERLGNGFCASLVPAGCLMVARTEIDPTVFPGLETVTLRGLAFYRKPGPEREARPGWLGPARPGPERISPPEPGSARPLPKPSPGGFPDQCGTGKTAKPASPPGRKDGRKGRTEVGLPRAATNKTMARLRRLADAGRINEGIQLTEDLLREHRLDPVPHFYQGLLLDQLGHLEEARQRFRRAIYLDRRFVLAHFHLGLVTRKLARDEEVRRCMENVLDLLQECDPEQTLPEGDGLRAAHLQSLTRAHLEASGP